LQSLLLSKFAIECSTLRGNGDHRSIVALSDKLENAIYMTAVPKSGIFGQDIPGGQS